MKIDYK